jgi:hypothetical protein
MRKCAEADRIDASAQEATKTQSGLETYTPSTDGAPMV